MTSLLRNLSEFTPVPFSRTHPAPRLGERLDSVSGWHKGKLPRFARSGARLVIPSANKGSLFFSMA